MDAMAAIGLFLFGMAFFTWTMRDVERSNEIDRYHRMAEKREFGEELPPRYARRKMFYHK